MLLNRDDGPVRVFATVAVEDLDWWLICRRCDKPPRPGKTDVEHRARDRNVTNETRVRGIELHPQQPLLRLVPAEQASDQQPRHDERHDRGGELGRDSPIAPHVTERRGAVWGVTIVRLHGPPHPTWGRH